MTIVYGDVRNVADIPTNGELWVSSPEWRPSGETVVTMVRETYYVTDGKFETGNLKPGAVQFEFSTSGAGQTRRKAYEFVIPDTERVNFADLLENAYEYPAEVVGKAQEAARRAEAASDRLASAERIESWVAESSRNVEAAAGSAAAAEAARDEAREFASAADGSAASAEASRDAAGEYSTSAKASRDAAEGFLASANAARAGAESARDDSRVNADKAKAQADRAEGEAGRALEHAGSAGASEIAAAGAATAAEAAKIAAGGHADRAEAAAKLADTEQLSKEITQKIAEIVDGAPQDLDTLRELAEYAKENRGITDQLNAAIGAKADKAELEQRPVVQVVKELPASPNPSVLYLIEEG